MYCTRPLEGTDKENLCVCLRWRATNEKYHSMREDNNRNFSVGEWFDVEPWSTMRSFLYVDKSNYCAKPFCNASAWPCHCFGLNKFYRKEMDCQHRLSSETVQ